MLGSSRSGAPVDQPSTDVVQGTLDMLTALKRLERAGWLDAEWRETENARRAKYYILTREGRKQLALETADWSRRVSAIARLLEAEG